MNERIKELAAQAGASRRAGVGGLVFRDSELEKFAELIVKECYVHCGGQLMDKPPCGSTRTNLQRWCNGLCYRIATTFRS